MILYSNCLLFGSRESFPVLFLKLLLHVRKNWHVNLKNRVKYHINYGKLKSYLIFHAELSLALCRPPKLIWISKHVIQGNIGNSSEFIIANFTIYDRSSPCIETTDDITWKPDKDKFRKREEQHALEFRRCYNLNIHNRLQNNWLGKFECLTKSSDGSKAESQFTGIDRMEGAIFQDQTTPCNRVAR